MTAIVHRRDAKDAEGKFFIAFRRKEIPSYLCVLSVSAVNYYQLLFFRRGFRLGCFFIRFRFFQNI